MHKGPRHPGEWVPAMDVLEDRGLLSPFGGLDFGHGPQLAPRDLPSSPPATYSGLQPGGFDHRAPDAFGPGGGGDHAFHGPSPSLAWPDFHGGFHPDHASPGPDSPAGQFSPASPIASSNVANPGGSAMTPQLVMIPAADASRSASQPDRGAVFTTSLPRNDPAPRAPGPPATTPTASVSTPELAALENNGAKSAAPPAPARNDAAPAATGDVAPPPGPSTIAQAPAPAANLAVRPSPALAPRSPESHVLPAPDRAPAGSGAVAPEGGQGDRVANRKGEAPVAPPDPRGADVLAATVPDEAGPLDEELAALLRRFEGLGPLPTTEPGGGSFRVLPVVTALTALEVARRWRNRRYASPSIGGWKTRSTMLRGFF